MDNMKWLEINTWWKALFWLGVSIGGIALLFDIQLLNVEHLLGLGIGFIVIGLSMFAAQKGAVVPAPEFGGFFHGKITQHNIPTLIFLVIGFIITLLFMILIIIDLV